jgi:SAM-dependent methyltransferase
VELRMDEPRNTEPGDSTGSEEQQGTSEGWADYHSATRGLPPHPLLVRAVALLPVPGTALDLGCGAGRDSLFLVDRGFHVTSVDTNADAVTALRALKVARLRVVQSTFAEFAFAQDGYDLINAQLALPFNPPETFDAMFGRLVRALRPGGIFTGNLFGVRDEWNVPGSELSFHTRSAARLLLRGLRVRVFDEEEYEVPLVGGKPSCAFLRDHRPARRAASPGLRTSVGESTNYVIQATGSSRIPGSWH